MFFFFILKAQGVLHCSPPPTHFHSKQHSLFTFKYNCWDPYRTGGARKAAEGEACGERHWYPKGQFLSQENWPFRESKLNYLPHPLLFCDIIKMHVTYQHSSFCIHNLKLKLISCHKDLTHLLTVPSQKSVLLQEKQLYVYTLAKNTEEN